jgi:hypothetical protein
VGSAPTIGMRNGDDGRGVERWGVGIGEDVSTVFSSESFMSCSSSSESSFVSTISRTSCSVYSVVD